jgi:hypothetical protein
MEVELQHEGLEDICSQKRLSENVKDMSKKFGQDSCMTCPVNGGPRSEKFGDALRNFGSHQKPVKV